MFGTVHDGREVPSELAPQDVSDATAVADLESLGFVALGVEVCLLPFDPAGLDGAGSDDELQQLVDQGTRSVALASPDGSTVVSPEIGLGQPMATYLSVLATGHLVCTRRAPATDPLERAQFEVEDAEVRRAFPRWFFDLLETFSGMTDANLHPDLPSRGLFRRTVSGTLQEVYVAHQAHVRDAEAATEAQVVPVTDMAIYLAAIRRKYAVMEAHIQGSEHARSWLGSVVSAALILLVALAARTTGLSELWLLLSVAAPVTAAVMTESVQIRWLRWALLATPLWLAAFAWVQHVPVLVPLLLGAVVAILWLMRGLWGLGLQFRVYPAISARVSEPKLIRADQLVNRYRA